MRFKAVVRGGQELHLVESGTGFAESDWCRMGHVGWVLEGTLNIEFPDRTETIRAGQVMFLLAGEAERHKAHVVDKGGRLIFMQRK